MAAKVMLIRQPEIRKPEKTFQNPSRSAEATLRDYSLAILLYVGWPVLFFWAIAWVIRLLVHGAH